MLHPFVSTHGARAERSSVQGLTVSVVLHASLIAAAIVVTTQPDTPVTTQQQTAGVERIVFSRLTPQLELAAGAAMAAAKSVHRGLVRTVAAPRAIVNDLAALKLDIDVTALNLPDVGAPEVDLAALAERGLTFDDNDARALLRAANGHDRVALHTDGTPYTQDMVELAVASRTGNPVPRYPYVLRADGVQASFVVRFVVDSTGRVEPRSLSFPQRVHRLLAASVRDALLRSRFFPAQIHGQPVPQLVQQQFSFVLQER